MHFRRLTVATFAMPLLFAACSGDDSDGVQRPDGTDSTLDESMDGLQPSETPGMGGGGGEGTQGDGEGPGDPVLQQPDTILPLGSVENRGATCTVADLPEGNTLPTSMTLPDPFTKLDGTRISQKSEWICRREEILQQTYKYIYGQKPPKPESVTGTVSETEITVNIEHNGQTRAFTAGVTLPEGTGPFPAVIAFSGGGAAPQMRNLGVAVINFAQGAVGGGNSGLFGELYGANSAGNLAAWAWGASRIIDVLETDSSIIDSSRLAVTGCSFLGKAAFATGALDERIALTVPVESGIGGVPAYKLVPQIEPNPTGAGDGPEQPQHAINNGWLPTGSLVGDFARLPVDTHEIIGLIAPRGLLILGNTGGQGQYYKNLDFRTEYATAVAGKEIFAALGYAENVTYDSRNVMHCQYNAGSDPALQANVDKFLAGGSGATGTFTTDWEGVRVEPAPYIEWTTPTLEGEL